MRKEIKKVKGRPPDLMKQFGISNGTLERVLSLFPDNNTGFRWTELKDKCTGENADPQIRMSKQTLSKGLKFLQKCKVIIKEKRVFNGKKTELYRKTEPHEIARYKIHLPNDEYEKMVWRYSELEEAKIWISEITGLSYEEIVSELYERALHKKNIDETRTVMLPLPEEEDEEDKNELEWEKDAKKKGVYSGQVHTFKGITGTYRE